jgi:non-ribosomal peptide synthetase-like protein
MEPTLLHDIFADVVRRCPDRVAIDVPPSALRPRRTVTYAELDRLSDMLAQLLSARVNAADSIVIVLLPRDSERPYAAQLGIMKAGAAFACVDPSFPDRQIQTVVDDAEPVAILTDEAGRARLARLRTTAPILDIGAITARSPSAAPETVRPARSSPTDLAYLIYTSGTTGAPKGVMIEHRSIVNLVRGDIATLGVTAEDRVAQNSSSAYDSSIEETWFALAVGATLVVMDDETVRLGPDLPAWLRRERITMFCPPPTLLRATGCANPEQELPDLRLLHPGGEALTQDVADRWARNRRLVNDYGPTEATVTALRAVIAPGQRVSIGHPVPGMRAWVLDEHLQPVPDGVAGELCLGGIGLARGYRNDPELTARKFVSHPELGRIYRTGDLALRDASGCFHARGRIDTQVKIRGYRIELEAIETRLAECRGVREAACAVQGNDTQKMLVAFVVPEQDGALDADSLKQQLRGVLPSYMVPARIGTLPSLPRSASGKLDRRALPALLETSPRVEVATERGNEIEAHVATAMQRALGRTEPVALHDDFFADLGGDSLAAAVLVSRLREHPATAALTVRDVYEAKTAAALATRAAANAPATPIAGPTLGSVAQAPEAAGRPQRKAAGHPRLATLVQLAALLLGTVIAAPLLYLLTFVVVPASISALGPALAVVLLPLLLVGGVVGYTLLTAALAVVAKRLLIGVYRPSSSPVWGSFYVRNWLVQRCVRLVPRRLLEATELENALLRALGARIGKRVHLHRGATVWEGGWDLLTIGDDAAIGQDAALNLVSLADAQIVVGPVTIGARATVETRASVGTFATVGAGSVLAAWSYLEPGDTIPDQQRWDGVPAQFAGPALATPVAARGPDLAPLVHAALLIGGRLALAAIALLPAQLLVAALAVAFQLDAAQTLDWLLHPLADSRAWAFEIGLVLTAAPLALLLEAVMCRLLGAAPVGVIGLFGTTYVRARLKTELVESACRWLCGTLLWPVWLRAAGMRIGRGSEVGTIIDTVPDLVEIGADSFFADGVYLAGPRISHGTVTLARVRIGNGVFLGNHAVVPCGRTVADGVLIGVCSVADDRATQPGKSWFGHPPFELVHREPVRVGRDLTHEPSWPRYLNRLLWELLRFGIPLLPVALALSWFGLLEWAARGLSTTAVVLLVVPALEIVVLIAPLLCVLALKWLLLGRVQPGTHPLWSCWVSRWDFLYVAWDFLARSTLAAAEGSLLLNAYLHAMGMQLGRRVALGPGFEQVADPDMIEIGDDATVTSLNQAHTFEDRVLKIDRFRIGKAATIGRATLLLYGADVGDGTGVAPNSAVMKGERLLPSHSYVGRPTRAASRGEARR